MLIKEGQIVKGIMDYLAAERIYAIRLNTAGIQIEKRFFRAHSGGKGTADILALIPLNTSLMSGARHGVRHFREHNGRGSTFLPVWIEAKAPKGKQSEHQKEFETYVRSLGHVYLLARGIDTVRGWLCVESGL